MFIYEYILWLYAIDHICMRDLYLLLLLYLRTAWNDLLRVFGFSSQSWKRRIRRFLVRILCLQWHTNENPFINDARETQLLMSAVDELMFSFTSEALYLGHRLISTGAVQAGLIRSRINFLIHPHHLKWEPSTSSRLRQCFSAKWDRFNSRTGSTARSLIVLAAESLSLSQLFTA